VRIPRTRVVGAAAVIAVAAGGGAAFAVNRTSADSPRTEREAFLADVAGRLGVSVDELRKAFREAAEARGRKGQRPFGPGSRGHGPRGHGHFGRGPGHAVHESFDAAANYLGLTRQQLMSRLVDGKSLADLAADEGKSVDGLRQAIRAAIVERLDAPEADGRLTQPKKQELLGRLDSIIDDLVQRSRSWRGHP
jgi:hypothetical protein